MPDKVIVLNDGPPWGFRMTGGKSTGSPLKISRVNNAGKAAKSGVREGFIIESINSASVDHLTSNEAQALIRNSGDTLTIGVYRQSKTNTEQNDKEHETEAKACAVDKSERSKQTESETTNKKSKRVRKRRRKKKRAESPEKLNNQQPEPLPFTKIEQNQELVQITEHPTIEIIPANTDLRVDELEWIKKNEALLIAELETRRKAGLPIQVVVRVEKITPSMPEYCQIIPDFCHLEVIKEETSASDEDPRKEIWECSEKINKASNFEKLPNDWEESDDDGDTNHELNSIVEINSGETNTSECHLERLESPSLVRETEILRFADIITTDNECVVELETLEPLKKLINNVEKTYEQQTCSISKNDLNNEVHKNDTFIEDKKNNENQIQHKTIENQTLNNNLVNGCCTNTQIKTNILLDNELYKNHTYKEVYYQQNSVEVDHCNSKHVTDLKVLDTKPQIINNSNSTEPISCNINMKKCIKFSRNEYHAKTTEVSYLQENSENEDSSDDSTIKPSEIYKQTNNYSIKTKSQNKVSIYDKLKQIAKLLQDDTDDYEEIQSSQTTSRCVSIGSEADVDTDWVSFTLSDGESSKSLCLSPSQSKSVHVPSTVNETFEIIDLHKKFLNRTKSPNLSPHPGMTTVEILSYNVSPSPSSSKSYSSEVIDEACRMCGTSDEPLSDAECLVTLRKYRDTRSRLLDVIQKEQQLNRSVIDRPSPMPMFIDTLSVPDNHTRELMYTEYMEKVKERENRLHNKVIRISKASRPLSSGTLQALNAIDTEFVTKARERLEKLGVEADVDSIEMKDDEYYPKHLVDIVPEEEVCIEEVQMNVWPSLIITLLRYTNQPKKYLK